MVGWNFVPARRWGWSVRLARWQSWRWQPRWPRQESAATSDTDLAKQIQNPVSDLYTAHFQNNTNFNYGPHHGTQNILNIQPVIPIRVNDDWNIVTCTILPLIWNPSVQSARTVPFGVAPITFSAFLVPTKPIDGWLWGAGPVMQVPVASSATLGSNVWGGGPTAVVVKTTGPWVTSTLLNNAWSFGGLNGPNGKRAGGTGYSVMTMQPFVNYNFDQGWYLGTSPIISADWLTAGNKAWTLPVGGGRVIKLWGEQPANLSLGAYWNALRPAYGSTWQLRTQVSFIF